jgi:3-hydroxybutyryl-CoA dehydrogenase
MDKAQKIVVIGAGLMGTGIAHGFALSGFAVLLIDTDQKALSRATAQIGKLLRDGVALGKLDAARLDATLARLKTQTAIDDAIGDAVLLVETATEKLDIKQEILRRAASLLPTDAVLASNTSALSISELAAASGRPDRFLGMHFFNPVHKMKLLEIIRGIETSDGTVAKAQGWAKALGKTSIVVNEAPGFTTSRMSAMMGNEAMYMLSEGVASAEDIDTALRLGFNHPMGPLELGDLTGWDTRLSVLHYLHQTLGDKFRPCPLIIKMVKSGRIGRKSGKGVYHYDAEGNKIPGSGLRIA